MPATGIIAFIIFENNWIVLQGIIAFFKMVFKFIQLAENYS
jgi:hypothetical protein